MVLFSHRTLFHGCTLSLKRQPGGWGGWSGAVELPVSLPPCPSGGALLARFPPEVGGGSGGVGRGEGSSALEKLKTKLLHRTFRKLQFQRYYGGCLPESKHSLAIPNTDFPKYSSLRRDRSDGLCGGDLLPLIHHEVNHTTVNNDHLFLGDSTIEHQGCTITVDGAKLNIISIYLPQTSC